jgi:hypothetical protein
VTYPGYPLSTEKLGDLAVEIQQLADWANTRLPGTGVEVITGHYSTNVSGDISVLFTTITNVQCVIGAAFLNQTSPPLWVQLTVPVFAILASPQPDIIVARVYSQAGVPLVSQPVQVCWYGWGTPK